MQDSAPAALSKVLFFHDSFFFKLLWIDNSVFSLLHQTVLEKQ